MGDFLAYLSRIGGWIFGIIGLFWLFLGGPITNSPVFTFIPALILMFIGGFMVFKSKRI